MSCSEPLHELKMPLTEVLFKDLYGAIFPPHLKLVPQLNEVYELELAYYESRILSDEELSLIHISEPTRPY